MLTVAGTLQQDAANSISLGMTKFAVWNILSGIFHAKSH